jgi:hypothetical protein
MFSCRRSLLTLAAAGAALSILAARAHGQFSGIHSRAVSFAPVDAAALGDTLGSSVGLFTGEELGAAVGVGAWGGSLRALGGLVTPFAGSGLFAGLGYAHPLATPRLAGAIHGTVGAELRAGYRHETNGSQDAGALRLSAPFGVSLGQPSGSSLGVYVAPYVESGLMRQLGNTLVGCAQFCDRTLGDAGLQTAVGVGAGFRAAFHRFAVEFAFSDVSWQKKQFYGDGQATLGLTYRLGR